MSRLKSKYLALLAIMAASAMPTLGVLMPEYGALPIGQANYPIPANATTYYYVAPSGSDTTGLGTFSSPWKTLQKACDMVPSGSTIVLRAGQYRETATIASASNPKHNITIQNHPNESVWFIGSDIVPNDDSWTPDGTTGRYYRQYLHDFGQPVTHDNNHPLRAEIDPDYPAAGYFDMVFVNDIPLKQVLSPNEVDEPGVFYVDRVNRRLYIWGVPTGTIAVANSSRTKALSTGNGPTHSYGHTIRGIGFKHFGCYNFDTAPNEVPERHVHMNEAIGCSAPNTTFENVVIRDCARVGLAFWGYPDATDSDGDGKVTEPTRDPMNLRVVHCSLLNNGQVGFTSNVNDYVFERNLVQGNNVERFRPVGKAGGVKVAGGQKLLFKANKFYNNLADGLWCDITCYDVTVASNVFYGNTNHGMDWECSNILEFVNNYVAYNGLVKQKDYKDYFYYPAGLHINEASNVQAWNNTFLGNGINLDSLDGNRDLKNGGGNGSKGPWDDRYSRQELISSPYYMTSDTLNNTIKNNVFINGLDFAVLELKDQYDKNNPDFNRVPDRKRSVQEMLLSLDYNGYHRSLTTPLTMVSWQQTDTNSKQSSNLNALRTDSAQYLEPHGVESSGSTSPLIDETAGLFYVRRSGAFGNKGTTMPANIALAMGAAGLTTADLGVMVRVTEAESTLSSLTTPTPVLTQDPIMSGAFGFLYKPLLGGATSNITCAVVVPEQLRNYSVRIGVRRQSDAGIYQLAVTDVGTTPEDFGPTINCYASSPGTYEFNLGTRSWTTGGTKTFRLTATGTTNGGYAICLDYIKLIPLP